LSNLVFDPGRLLSTFSCHIMKLPNWVCLSIFQVWAWRVSQKSGAGGAGQITALGGAADAVMLSNLVFGISAGLVLRSW
jgi:hypothetical protein